MSRHAFQTCICAGALSLLPLAAGARTPLPATDFVPNELLISLAPEAAATLAPGPFPRSRLGIRPLDQLATESGVREIQPVFRSRALGADSGRIDELDRVFKLTLSAGQDVFRVLEEYRRRPEVEFAELNLIYEATLQPTDRRFSEQWALHNKGENGDKRDADIDAPQAWELERGSPRTVIAILDTGVSNHPDLRGTRILRERGWDFINDRRRATDDHGHGTYVAGIAAATSNNRRGVAGVCWRCSVLPVKVLDEEGRGSSDSVAQGIRWAADKGARIINMSLGYEAGCGCSRTVARAINYAWKKGVLLVAASGNDGEKNEISYPAASPRVLSVGATDSRDKEASFSNFDRKLDLLAPGVDILGLDAREGEVGYRSARGTSAAAPHAAGVAGLLLSAHRNLDNRQLWQTLRVRGDRPIRGRPRRLNASRALRQPLRTRVNAPKDTCTEEPDCPAGCPAEVALAPKETLQDWMYVLYTLRSEILAKSAIGGRLAELYDKHRVELSLILLLDHDFRNEVLSAFEQWGPLLLGALGGEQDAFVTPEQATAARVVFDGFVARAGTTLSRDLHRVDEHLSFLGVFDAGTSRSDLRQRLAD